MSLLLLNSCSEAQLGSKINEGEGVLVEEIPAATMTLNEFFEQAEFDTEIVDDIRINLFVASSDEYGNFYKSIYLQFGELSLRYDTEVTFMHTKYPLGSYVQISLKGMTLTNEYGVNVVRFPNGNLGSQTLLNNSLRFIETANSLYVQECKIADLDDCHIGDLVKVDGLRAVALGSWYQEGELAKFVDAADDTLCVDVSEYAHFADEMMPMQKCDVTGIYNKNNGIQLIISSLEDISVDN